MDALKLIAQDSMKAEVPNIEIGDTIKIDVNIREGERERIQVFEGTVIARKGSGVSETFTAVSYTHLLDLGSEEYQNELKILADKINHTNGIDLSLIHISRTVGYQCIRRFTDSNLG